jgi:alginate O-acetyltransferase complex protein AlgI
MNPGGWSYIVFLGATFLVFHLLPFGRAREYFLLLASYCFFWLFSPLFLMPLLFVTVAGFFGAIMIVRLEGHARQTSFLFLTSAVVAAPFLVYKYREAALAMVQALGTGSGGEGSWIFPVGISFYTLVAVAYLIDVYVGTAQPITSISRFALFLNFFPKLTAGPLERANQLVLQLACDRPFRADYAISGLKLILVGLVMKAAIADTIAGPVMQVWSQPPRYGALELVLGALYYTYYAYADFAGYSLIALGSALLFGIELSQNFRQPLLSRTILEFWRDWHMTLFLWLRDYVFTPLRLMVRSWGLAGLGLSLFLTLLFSGVWHGARLNYIVYALMQAVLITVTFAVAMKTAAVWKRRPVLSRLVVPAEVALTFFLIVATFVMFASPSVGDAIAAYGKIFSADLIRDLRSYQPSGPDNAKAMESFVAYAPLILALFAGDVFVRLLPAASLYVARWRRPAEFVFYNGCLLVLIYTYWLDATVKPFLYFRF